MESDLFTREVLIDISVNFLPVSILAVFIALFVVITPWGIGLTLSTAIQLLLMILPLVGVAVVTYVAAKKIEIQGEGHQ